ncbi:phage major capsid protein [Dolosigranulum pigrum]|uniref:phage major capsid protein n=1 Tax=Dolosigranulum pigrum TaxID=29394 RepID=UPI00191828B3|nr:phage major capsid protein [Dolosigranulum pigrum]
MVVQEFNPANVMLSEKKDGSFTPEMTGTVMKEVRDHSLVMRLGKYEEMNGRQEKKFSFQTDGVSAYWVDEGQKIQTSKPGFAEATMRAKKLGVIILASREYLNYTWSQFFNEMKDDIAEAFYKKFDQAAILNKDNPFDFSVDQVAKKIEGPITFDNVLALEDVIYDEGGTVEAFVSNNRNHSTLRQAVNDKGESIYDRQTRQIDGITTVHYDDLGKGIIYAGDWTKNLIYGVPYNITFKISEDAQISTIKNSDGTPVNLYEQELIALRATMDVAFMTLKDEAFAKLEVPGAEAGESEEDTSGEL